MKKGLWIIPYRYLKSLRLKLKINRIITDLFVDIPSITRKVKKHETNNILKRYNEVTQELNEIFFNVYVRRCMIENYNNIPSIYKPYINNVFKKGVSFYCGGVQYVNEFSKSDVKFDESNGFRYVMFFGKRLYMRNDISVEKIVKIANDLATEQQEHSPHRYLADDFNVCNGDIVFDVGAAEGNFSLCISDVAREIHVFEYDDKWIEALHKTFDELPTKIKIVKGYVSNVTSDNNKSLTIDDYCIQNGIEKIDFLKVDVEGAEQDLLEGARKMINGKRIEKICIATYHKIDDFEKIKEKLIGRGYKVQGSEGYLLFSHISKRIEDVRPPYLAKGLMRARLIK